MARRGDNIHKRKDGRWEGRYKNGYKADGTVKYGSVYARTYSECKEKLIAMLSGLHTTETTMRCNVCFSDILSKWLVSNRIKTKGGTQAKYIQIIKTHIVPQLGGININKITSETVNEFLNSKLINGNRKTKSALSPSYVRTMAIIIESAINYAVTEDLCAPLKSPIKKPTVLQKELVVLSTETENKLMQKLNDTPSLTGVGILLALQTGLRIGEVCALSWDDVDLKENVINIRHTISRVPKYDGTQKSEFILDTPKTKSSVRIIPIPPRLKSLLLFALENKKSEFVVSDKKDFLNPRTFDYRYRKLLKQYNIEVFNFHTLRHTFATRCAQTGMDAKTLSWLLGHSSSTTSLNLYVHPSIEVAARQLEQIFCFV